MARIERKRSQYPTQGTKCNLAVSRCARRFQVKRTTRVRGSCPRFRGISREASSSGVVWILHKLVSRRRYVTVFLGSLVLFLCFHDIYIMNVSSYLLHSFFCYYRYCPVLGSCPGLRRVLFCCCASERPDAPAIACVVVTDNAAIKFRFSIS